ncbi:MAG TPA: choice-of-anchor tandem repeat GloVer-containing protein [Stellaceae bacterium]|jgi:uncharacterized repeat protein (TIGR03803 family)
MQNLTLGRLLVPLAAVLAAATLAPLSGAAAASLEPETVLYSFCARGGKACTDGAGPLAGLIMDAVGHLYGTTPRGGAHNGGTVFELTPNTAKTKWTETVIYSFCAQPACTDGELPEAGLVMDAAGHLYGTTFTGGRVKGTVFELTPNAAKTKWTETVLYSFSGSTDGLGPVAGLLINPAGRLYGTTDGGGARNAGTVFELAPNAAKTEWTETILYSFCSEGGLICTDGERPRARLITDASGRRYGTTSLGGAHYNAGVVFELTPNAAKTKWTEAVLYSFCARGEGERCTDGASPYAGLIMDASGDLYGTTFGGGGPSGGGSVFALTPNAAKTKWTQTVLCASCGGSSGLIMDRAEHLYGTTEIGGPHGGGTVFELAPNAAKTKWTQTILYNFCARSASGVSCADGQSPFAYAGLIMDASGRLYGTTAGGRAHAEGTVFELP